MLAHSTSLGVEGRVDVVMGHYLTMYMTTLGAGVTTVSSASGGRDYPDFIIRRQPKIK
jgi:hypothetical protein